MESMDVTTAFVRATEVMAAIFVAAMLIGLAIHQLSESIHADIHEQDASKAWKFGVGVATAATLLVGWIYFCAQTRTVWWSAYL